MQRAARRYSRRNTGPPTEPARIAAGTLLEQPVISQAWGGWRYSVADLGLDRGALQPVALRLSIRRAFVPGLPVGDFRLQGMAGDAGDAGWAFRLRTQWRLAGPWARRSPPASERPQA
jgi:hypothetical protein